MNVRKKYALHIPAILRHLVSKKEIKNYMGNKKGGASKTMMATAADTKKKYDIVIIIPVSNVVLLAIGLSKYYTVA